MTKALKYLALACALFFAAEYYSFSQDAKLDRIVDDLIIQAVDKYQQGKADDARILLQGAESLSPNNDAVHYWLGLIAAKNNDVENTLAHLEKAVALDSTNQWYLGTLGKIYKAIGKPDKAQPIFEKLSNTNHKNPEYLASLSEVYIDNFEIDKADSALTRLENATGPSDYIDMSRLELLRLRGRFDDYLSGMNKAFASPDIPAKGKCDFVTNFMRSGDPRFIRSHLPRLDSLVQTCLRVHPADTSVAHLAISYYYAVGNYDKMLQTCKQFPQHKFAVYSELDYYYKNQDYQAAADCCDRLLELVKDNPADCCAIHLTKADCLHSMGSIEKAYQEFESTLKCFPNDPTVLNNYAYVMSCDGRNLRKCARLSKKAVEAQPENCSFLDTYAWILYLQKKYPQAKTYFKKALIYGGKDSDVVLGHYADTLEALGETDLAEGYRQKAILKKNEKKSDR